jgi:hypothetical protein
MIRQTKRYTHASQDTQANTRSRACTRANRDGDHRPGSRCARPGDPHLGTNAGPVAPGLLALALVLVVALPPSGCGSLPVGSRGPQPVGLLAAGPRPAQAISGDAATRSNATDPVSGARRAPEEVLADPAERMRFMERMRVQILHRTRRVSPADYQRVVRPGLERQLRAMGLLEDEVELILADVERSRAVQAGWRDR